MADPSLRCAKVQDDTMHDEKEGSSSGGKATATTPAGHPDHREGSSAN